MKILGIDPGSLTTGYGLIHATPGRDEVITFGTIKLRSKEAFVARLNTIYDGIVEIIQIHQPDLVALENVFYGKNIESILKLGQVRGVVMLATVKAAVPLVEYSPREVKQAVTGNGAASKEQVCKSIFQLLQLQEPVLAFDITDALAVAICGAHRVKF